MANRILIFAAVAGLVRLVTLGMFPLMDMTESRYAEIARKMVELGDWVTLWIDYDVPFWGKPPLAIWLTAFSFKVFGINEFAARLPHWLCGLLIIYLLWGLAAPRSRREAIYMTALLTGSLLFLVSSGAVSTDITLALSTTAAMRGFWLGLHGTDRQQQYEPWLLFAGLGIGMLAKGLIAIVLVILPIVIWSAATGNAQIVWRRLPWLRGALVTLLISLPWYVLAESRTPGFLEYFIVGEHFQRFLDPGWQGDLYGVGHKFPMGTIWLFLLQDTLPWSLILLVIAFRWRKFQMVRWDRSQDPQWRTFLVLWGFMPVVFFTPAVNILWAYVLPGLPGLALWAAGWLAHQPNKRIVERLLAGGVALMIFAELAFFVILPATGTDKFRSTKILINEYQSCHNNGERLIFVDPLPFSAAFYSSGRVRHLPNAAAIADRLGKEPALFAIKSYELFRLPPEVESQLTVVSQYGFYTLFSEKGENMLSCLPKSM